MTFTKFISIESEVVENNREFFDAIERFRSEKNQSMVLVVPHTAETKDINSEELTSYLLQTTDSGKIARVVRHAALRNKSKLRSDRLVEFAPLWSTSGYRADFIIMEELDFSLVSGRGYETPSNKLSLIQWVKENLMRRLALKGNFVHVTKYKKCDEQEKTLMLDAIKQLFGEAYPLEYFEFKLKESL